MVGVVVPLIKESFENHTLILELGTWDLGFGLGSSHNFMTENWNNNKLSGELHYTGMSFIGQKNYTVLMSARRIIILSLYQCQIKCLSQVMSEPS